MSFNAWQITCPYCGYDGAQNRKEGSYYTIEYCYVCNYNKAEAINSLINEMYKNALEELDRNDYKNSNDFKNVCRELSMKMAIEWLEDEEGDNKIPSKSEIIKAKKIVKALEIIDQSVRISGYHDYTEFAQD